jgi:NPCBM-associated, NEW3 domain of alpha-galactosidase
MYHAATPGTEYDDATDPMTVGYNWLMGVNAPHRQQFGWHSAEGLKLVTESGTHTLAPLASDPSTVSSPQILMLKKPDTNEYYYLSYRLPIGFDRNIDSSFHGLVSVHQYKGDGSSTKTFRLSGLSDAGTFGDSVNGITVTMTSHDSAGATVSVTLPAAAAEPVPPAVSATPAAQTGEPGSARSYTLAVTNRNAASRPAATFDLTSVAPSGWNASLSAQRLTLASGETGHAQLTLAAPQTASLGEYHSSVQVTDAAQPAQAASTDVTLTLAPATDRTPPSAPANVQSSVNQKLKEVVVSWTASADNVQVSGYRVWRNGTMVALSASTRWTDPSTSSGVTYTYFVEAYDAAGNVSSPSSSASVTPGGGGAGRRK